MELSDVIKKYKHLSDVHITRAKCKFIVVSQGEVIDVLGEDYLEHCPLYSMVCDKNPRGYMKDKIRKFGYYTPQREIYRESLGVPFGTSEMIMFALKKHSLDCAITACDGVGTVITDKPGIAQGIGARMNGLFYTTPIPELLSNFRKYGCIVYDDAKIDQLRGLKRAIEEGYKRIIITVNGFSGENLQQLRKIEGDSQIHLIIAAICTTGINHSRAQEIVEYSDLSWACASKFMRECSAEAIVQITKAIPIFVYSQKGLEFIAQYADNDGAKKLRKLDAKKQYLLAASREGNKIYFGPAKLAITETELPVSGKKEPRPLT